MQFALRLALIAAVLVSNGCAHSGPRGASLHDCAWIAASAGVAAGAATGAVYAENNGDGGEGAAVGASVAVGTALVGLGACWWFAPERAQAERETSESCTPCQSSLGPRLARAPEPVALPIAASRPSPCEAPLILEGVHFDTDRHAIGPAVEPVLQRIVQPLLACPSRRIRIDAHTDSVGSSAYNQSLSERRAFSVKQFLVHHGVPSDRLESKGFGETRPTASNATREGRARNRRVELHPID